MGMNTTWNARSSSHGRLLLEDDLGLFVELGALGLVGG